MSTPLTARGADLVARLVELRKAAGLTTTQVARRMHCCRVNIVKFEHECSSGQRSPSLDLLQRYAAVVGAQITLEVQP